MASGRIKPRMRRKKAFIWIGIGATVAAIVVVMAVRSHRLSRALVTFRGAVYRSSDDPRRELPIADAMVTVTRGSRSVSTRSDPSGYFQVTFPEVIWPGQTVRLSFRHPDYKQLDLEYKIQFRSSMRRLYVAPMEPSQPVAAPSPKTGLARPAVVSNIRLRYTENSQTEENISSVVKTFQVISQGNVPCRHQSPCSPDGNWKANSGSIALDAGSGNELRNVRASCIAGPCPFTRIDPSGFQQGGRTVVVSALDWSDTATFLAEAEVYRTMIASSVRYSYPLIFERTLTFTMPGAQEGVTIEAEVNGAPMVFPLGPDDPYLSWASCTKRKSTPEDQSVGYRCELKSGYRF